MLVDSHVHVWSSDEARYPRISVDGAPTAIDGSADILFRTLDLHGVDAAVIVQPRMYGDDHTYLLDTLSQYRDRAVAVAALDPRHEGALAALSHLVYSGIKGLRLDPHRWGVGPLLDGEVLPLWDCAARHSIPIEFLIRPDQLPAIARLVARTTDLPVIVEHAARYGVGPDEPLESLLELARWPNLTVKISALAAISGEPPPHRDLWAMIGRIVEVFGPERLMWGSDMPWIDPETYGAERAGAMSWPFLDDDGREWLFGQTATRVFGLM